MSDRDEAVDQMDAVLCLTQPAGRAAATFSVHRLASGELISGPVDLGCHEDAPVTTMHMGVVLRSSGSHPDEVSV